MTEAQAEQRLTIDELAQTTGLTVRNVRSYQSRGLIPPPRGTGQGRLLRLLSTWRGCS